MERFALTLVAGMLFAGSAQASSMVALDAMKKPLGPSMVVIDASSASPSVVSMTSEDGTVSDEKVAAIGDDEDARNATHFAPMVMRGGIVGNAFASTVGQAPTPQPESKTASAEPPRGTEPAPQPNMPELATPR